MSLKDNGNFELAILTVSDPIHLFEVLQQRCVPKICDTLKLPIHELKAGPDY